MINKIYCITQDLQEIAVNGGEYKQDPGYDVLIIHLLFSGNLKLNETCFSSAIPNFI